MPDADDWRIDHTGIGVSDIGRSAKFYDAALSALGLRAIVRITKTFEIADRTNDSELGGVGYGATFPIFWIDVFHAHGAKQHTAFRARSREEVQAFHSAALSAGGETMAGRDFAAAAIRRAITRHSSSIPTATTSKRCFGRARRGRRPRQPRSPRAATKGL